MREETAKDFLKSVANKYAEALKIDGSKDSNRIMRGRSKAVGSVFEDLFAMFVWNRLKSHKGYYIFVDLCLSIPKIGGENRKPSIYPDFLLCKKIKKSCMEVVYICEVKCNIGWKRNLVNEAKVYIDRVDDLCKRENASARIVKPKRCGSSVDIASKDYKFTFNGNVKYDVVLLTSDNANIKNSDETVGKYDSKDSKEHKTRLFILTDDVVNMKGCEKFDFTPRMDKSGGFNALEERLKEVQSI